MGTRSDIVRSLAARTPALTRRILELSAKGSMPRGIIDHWLAQEVARDFVKEGIRLRWRSFEFMVPAASYRHYLDFEPETVRAFEKLLKPGMVVADVGANVGYTAALAAELVGPSGHVHAFEPSPATLRILERNLGANGLRNVSIHPYVVGECTRPRRFHVTEAALTDGAAAGSYSPTVATIELEERPLDSLLAPPVHLVKIDVEGTEIEVLRGMPGLLAQRDMTILVEWNPLAMKAAGYAPLDLPDTLREAGFGAITMLDDRAPGTERPLEDAVDRFMTVGWQTLGFVNLLARRG